jgi:Holliday junction DNA helicase RuvA
MIVQLQGKLVEATPLSAVIDVQGVGYEVHIPVTTAEKLPHNGEQLKLYTYPVYREDSQSLYGFFEQAERDFFRLLTEKVSGIGPKIALNMMSKLSLPALQSAIANGDATLLAKCPGIGKKTAERVIVELRDKVAAFGGANKASLTGFNLSDAASPPRPQSTLDEAILAMQTLGYKPDVAERAVRKAIEQLGDAATTEALIRAALR